MKKITKTTRSINGKFEWLKDEGVLKDTKDDEIVDPIQWLNILGGQGEELKFTLTQEDMIEDIEHEEDAE